MEHKIATAREKRGIDKRYFGALATLGVAALSLTGCSNPEPEHYLISVEASCIGPNGESKPLQLEEIKDSDSKNTRFGESYPDWLSFSCLERMKPSITEYSVTKYEANNTDKTSTGNGFGIVITSEVGEKSVQGVLNTQNESGNPNGFKIEFNSTSRVESVTKPDSDTSMQP